MNSLLPPGQKTVKKKWGREEWLVNFPLYCGKLLYLDRNAYCSVHKHDIKTESFFVLKGLVELKYCTTPRTENDTFDFTDYGNNKDDISFPQVQILREGDSFHIEPGLYHQFFGLRDSIILEISTEHFEEDSVRLTNSRGKND